jgi:hypothetical protein
MVCHDWVMMFALPRPATLISTTGPVSSSPETLERGRERFAIGS